MGKASRRKRFGEKEAGEQSPQRAVPNWPLFGLALVGVGITAYLTVSTWTEQSVAGCTVGSGCDVVLSSRWSKLFGLPTSLWGFLAYASLAGIAWIRRGDARWKLAWVVSLFGVLYSAYLTAVSFVELKAACPYCLASATVMIALLGTVTYQQPRELPHFSWRPWLLQTVAGGLVLVAAFHFFYFAGAWDTAPEGEDPQVRALAEHLGQSGAKFYGASWCRHCQEQKRLFGASAPRLPYIECSPRGHAAPQATLCTVVGIRAYPTWVIQGRRYERVLTLQQLAEYSGFTGDF